MIYAAKCMRHVQNTSSFKFWIQCASFSSCSLNIEVCMARAMHAMHARAVLNLRYTAAIMVANELTPCVTYARRLVIQSFKNSNISWFARSFQLLKCAVDDRHDCRVTSQTNMALANRNHAFLTQQYILQPHCSTGYKVLVHGRIQSLSVKSNLK